MTHKITVLLSDAHIDAVYDFIREDAIVPAPLGDPFHVKGVEPPIVLRDRQVKGLQLRVGKRRLAWQFEHERSDHGKRVYTCKALGYFDRGFNLSGRVERAAWHVTTDAAREAATVIAGKLLEGTAPAHRRAGARFAEVFEDYCRYLEHKATENGKPARWAYNVRHLGKTILLPQWATWTLAEMSERPDAVADWHKAAVRTFGATSANHAARIVRAMYKRRAGLDRTLNVAFLPTSGVKLAKVKSAQKGMAAADLPQWFVAWQKIDNATRRGYHLANLLTGARPGELARTRWRDFDAKAHVLTIGEAKAGNTIEIPTTPEIESAIKLAAMDSVIVYKSHGRRFLHKKSVSRKPDDFIFAGCQQIQHRHRTELPVMGHALRRTYKTIATDHCGVPDDISAALLGHVPEGMSQKYLIRWARMSGPAIIAAQAKISRTIMSLLKGGRSQKRVA
ncbi:MAG TPA: site-specific integrase [Pseudolabrys sp.]|jgi:integrase